MENFPTRLIYHFFYVFFKKTLSWLVDCELLRANHGTCQNIWRFDMKNIQKGFTLIELMIVVAIVGILAAIALPAYQNYSNKAKFTEVIAAAAPVKQAIDICFAKTGDVDDCDTAALVGYTLADAAGGQYVTSVVIAASTAAITVTSSVTDDDPTVTFTPAVSGGGLAWTIACSNTALC